MSQYVREPVGSMTVSRFLAIFYRHAPRYEWQWRPGRPLTDAQRVAEQKAAAESADL